MDEDHTCLGRAMVLGTFQCRGVLLLLHMVGQGPTVLAAGAGQVGCFLFFSSHQSYLPFLMPHVFGVWLDILKYCGFGRYNLTVVVSYYWNACSLRTG